MAKAKRVFEIARELGVESKEVLDKCRAEGVDLNNHMSSVKLGLEATIREWFSEEAAAETGGGTAVETARKVDLSKAKAKRRPRKKAKAAPAAPEEAAPTTPPAEPTATPGEGEPSESTEPVEPAAGEPAAPADRTPEPVAAEESTSSAEPGESADQAAAKHAPQAGASSPPRAPAAGGEREETEDEAGKVGPAGPRLETPGAAKLRGPKVVRIEEPEKVSPRRPRRSSQPLPPSAGGPPGGMPDLMRSTGPARGKGVGGGGWEEDMGRSPRRRRGGRRRGRSGEADAWFKGASRAQDIAERQDRLNRAAGFIKRRRQNMKKRSAGGRQALTPADVGGKVEIDEPITIKGLSAATGIKGADIVKFLFNKGVMATINAIIGSDMAQEVCLEYDIELVVKEAKTAEEKVEADFQARERSDIRRRPPVVAVLGHVDHGKTSLLDRIRAAEVAAGEAGGITQHIGAFRATIPGSDGAEKTVVFLDTPGHQAFTNMRSRGATLADLVVVVVAADDGVMPQTIESIDHARAGGVPIVVALNKTDKPEATEENIQRILGQLAERELSPVEWGGKTEVVKVSAETGRGVSDMIEMLDFQAELLEVTAGYDGSAYGQVIESELDPGRGAVARVLVRDGQLRVGDFVVIGRAFGKVRSMIDDHGIELQEAGPATPIELSGIDEVPDAGDKMWVTDSLKRAEEIAEQRRDVERHHELAAKTKITLDNVFEQMQAGETKELRVVLKADVQGSIEVLRKAMEEMGNEEVSVRVLHAAVGGITESDILLAEASDAVVIGFQVIASQQARTVGERRGVDIRTYRVIYDISDDIRSALEGMLSPEKREEVLGHAEVRDVFRVSKVGAVAGCYVTDGTVRRNALIRVTRDDIVIEHDRTLETLKRFKDDAKEVSNGMECGMKIEGYDDIQARDVLECYVQKEVRATLPA